MLTLNKVYERKKIAKAISLRFPKEDRRDVLFTLLTKMDLSLRECSRLYGEPLGEVRAAVERGALSLRSAIRAGRLKPEDLRGLS